jgi:hypothetical protein
MQQNLNLQHNHGFYLTEEENPKSKSSVVPHSLKDNICIYGGLEDERERERERERDNIPMGSREEIQRLNS